MIKILLFFLDFFDFFHKKKIKNFLKENNIVNFNIIFDIGGHKGESISFFLKNFDVNKIISFEPSPTNFEKLKKNTLQFEKKYKNTQIFLENFGIGQKKEKLKLKQHSESSSSTINDFNVESNYLKRKNKFLNLKNNFFKEVDINVITLEDYIIKNDIKKIDLLKIDTEGYEFDVLRGLKDKLSLVGFLMFEHHYDDMLKKEYTFKDINKLLKKYNFKKIFKSRMPFRKSFEYIYKNEKIT
ncbi:FkbM family methyltransferase [Pelagibacterales bacterium SAG-MED19]|nr:FkbM family methyltransferase [Pelagibacterales bacterium SAG-MED19]